MNNTLKNTLFFLLPFMPQFMLNWMNRQIGVKQFEKWQKTGFPVPSPHLLKQNVIAEYQEKSGCSVFIETGTYLGDMVQAQKKRFKRIISIELGAKLAENARKRFRRDKHITIIQGDSSKMLSVVLADINEPVLFFLDGHYSSGLTTRGDKVCPIFEELEAIFNEKKFNHVILIDDARLFDGTDDYPTMDELKEYIAKKNRGYSVEIKHDVIRCVIQGKED